MKFQPDTLAGVNAVSRFEAQRLWVGAAAYAHSVLVPWRGPVLAWEARAFDALTEQHFARIAALGPEVVIFGSGARLRFPAPGLLRTLIAQRIGVESMDSAAAARTYNVLVNEGRRVVGAFIVEAAAGSAG
jgi:uncharacterized protein